jgi:flagellar biosynthetic protein FliQ
VTDASVVEMLVMVLKTTAMVLGPILGAVLVVSVAISVLQAATQVQEYTLTFVPKLIAVAVVVVWLGPWMLAQLESLFTELFAMLPRLLGG